MIFIAFISLFFLNYSHAEDFLSLGIEKYQSQDFQAAQELFLKHLERNNNDEVVLYNLGLTEYKLGRKGSALGYWRKSLSVNSSFSPPEAAINYAISQMSAKPLSNNDLSSWEWLYSILTRHLNFHYFLILFLPLFCVTSYKISLFLKERRTSKIEGMKSELKSSTAAMILLTLVCFLIQLILLDSLLKKQATIITNAQIKTAPTQESSTLYEIPEGSVVIIKDVNSDWFQIEDPLGRLGWISATDIFITSDNK